MIEIEGNIWNFWRKHWIVITTNGYIKNNGDAVMGRGTALQAAKRFPELPRLLGQHIRVHGNKLMPYRDRGIVCFPVKHHWREKADIALIEESLQELVSWHGTSLECVCLTRPGCGNGRLDWKDVKPLCEKYLDNRFIVVELP